jgi:hypothetical protein
MIRNKYKIIDDYVILYVERRNRQKFEIYVDLETLEFLNDFNSKVHVDSYPNNKNIYYARLTKYLGNKNGKAKYKMYILNRLIMNVNNPKILIDHKNHNTLDNRKKNLRIIAFNNNLRYRKSKNSNNKSGYRNVCWINNWWRIQLQINGKNHLFSEKFDDIDKAGIFAKEMRERYYGEFAGNT